MRLGEIQAALKDEGLDGWLFFDHHRRDPLAYRVLQFAPGSMLSRRWYYFVPAAGEPRGMVHRIESHTLDALPGQMAQYSEWNEMVARLAGTARRSASESRCSIRRIARCRMWPWWTREQSS